MNLTGFLSDLEPKLLWLVGGVALYLCLCLTLSKSRLTNSRSRGDTFTFAGGHGFWFFIAIATTASFSGWIFSAHPASIYRDGLQYGIIALSAITIPFTGVLFLKRQWMLGERFGFKTPGDMFAAYFKGSLIRWLVVLVALCFSVPFLALQLQASGYLFHSLTGGQINLDYGMWAVAVLVFLYVTYGGLRFFTQLVTLHFVLMVAGSILLSACVLYTVGGIDVFVNGLKDLVLKDTKLTSSGYSHYIALSGVIQFVNQGADAVGGGWTGAMVLTYLVALMGIQTTPAFSMWAMASKSPQPFASQQVWSSALLMGGILIFLLVLQGVGGHLIGLDVVLRHSSEAATLVPEIDRVLKTAQVADLMSMDGKEKNLVSVLIHLTGDHAPYIFSFLTVCALAAFLSAGAVFMSTMTTMVYRDLIKVFILPDATTYTQRSWTRIFIGMTVIVALAIAIATDFHGSMIFLVGISVAFGFQMLPALIAICYVPWFTRQGICAGIICGLLVVFATDITNGFISHSLPFDLPFGQNPWTVHSAVWGGVVNLFIACLVSYFTQNRNDQEHKAIYHELFTTHDELPAPKRCLIPIGWALCFVWFFFAIGPGAILGNSIFGSPASPNDWLFNIPSLWLWQVMWWAAGVFMLWFLAYKLMLSRPPAKKITPYSIDD